MKLLRIFFFLLFACAFVALSQAENACSHPCGFVLVEVGGGEQSLVSIPFEPFDTSINGLLGDQLTASSNAASSDRVLKWNATAGEYVQAVKASDGTWVTADDALAAAETTFLPGDGFFIDNRQAEAQTVFLAGAVVLEPQQQVLLVAPLSLFGYPYSTASKLDTTALAGLLSESDIILDPAATEDSDTLAPGRAYWFQGDQSVSWNEPRPYQDLFPSNTAPPQITDLTYDSTKEEITLSIACTGAEGEKLDVLYQDVSRTEPFQTHTGWQVAQQNIPVTGTTHTWSEKPGKNCFGRYYLVLRTDIDADGNGVSDGREMFLGTTQGGQNGQTHPPANTTGLANMSTNGLLHGFGVTNGVSETSVVVQLRKGRVVYVDRRRGRDTLSGRKRVVVDSDGPKQTIRAGLREAGIGDTLVIQGGAYGEDLNISGKNIRVKIEGHVDLSGRRTLPPMGERTPRLITIPVDVTTNLPPQR